ncbi:hypothetical protein ACHAXR_006059 [Thalassiosira sp. AJA248-18]
MRRRQANGADNGIFILASPDISIDEKKHGRPQRNRYSSFISAGLLITVAAYLVLFTASSATFGSVGVKTGNNSTTSRGQLATSSKISDPTAPDKHPPKIPRRLIFTYKYNLIAPSVDDPPFNFKDPLTANVLQTINKYQHHWGAIDSESKQQPKEKVVVSFLSDNDCLEVIKKAEPLLVQHFNSENRGEFKAYFDLNDVPLRVIHKADICRVAELYLYGGYYFDIDIGVFQPLNVDDLYLAQKSFDPLWHLNAIKKRKFVSPSKDDIVTFATVFNNQGRFFQAFTAAMPGHPVLKRSLEYMVGYYEENLEQMLPQFIIDTIKLKSNVIATRKHTSGMGVGPFTLYVAHKSTTDAEWEDYVMDMMKKRGYLSEQKPESNNISAKSRYARFLYEVSLEDKDILGLGIWANVPLQDASYKKKIHWCNYVCFGGNRVYFYSRVPGSKGCPLEKVDGG